MSLLVISVLILSVNVFMATGVPTGMAVFKNPLTGLHGAITVRQNPVLGTYLVGQILNIRCFNSSSATLNPNETASINSCMLGITVNNWRTDTNDSTLYSRQLLLDREWRQTIFNLSNIKLPDIQKILSGGYNPFPNLKTNVTTTVAPVAGNGVAMSMQSHDTCADVGEVYNPRRNIFSGILGFMSPPGVIGNLMVNDGTGSIFMGPLELMTAGPTSVIGLPLVIWMDSITPVVNGTTITLSRVSNDRILDCTTITAN